MSKTCELIESKVYKALLQSIVSHGWAMSDEGGIIRYCSEKKGLTVDDCLRSVSTTKKLFNRMKNKEIFFFSQLEGEPFNDEDVLSDDRNFVELEGSQPLQEPISKSFESFGAYWEATKDNFSLHFDLNNKLFYSKCKVGVCLFNLFEDQFVTPKESRLVLEEHGTYLRGQTSSCTLYLGCLFNDGSIDKEANVLHGIVKTYDISFIPTLDDQGDIAFQLFEIEFTSEYEPIVEQGHFNFDQNIHSLASEVEEEWQSTGRKYRHRQHDDQLH